MPIHGEVRAHHVGLFRNARRALLQEHARFLHVVVQKVGRAVCGGLRDRCPRTRNTATSLAHVPQVVAGFLILQGGIDPNAVLLPTACAEEVRLAVYIDERVLATRDWAVRVGKHIAVLVLCAKIEGVVAGGVAKLVGLRGEDRRNRAVNILELHVHRDVIDTHSSLQGIRRSRFLQADGTRENRQRVGHVNLLFDVTVGNTICFNQLGRVRDWSSSHRAGGLRRSCRSSLRLHHDGAGGCQCQHSTSGCDGLHAVVLEAKSFRPEASTDGSSAQVCHELSPFQKLL